MITIKEEKIAEMMFDIWHESSNLKNPVMVGEYIANKLKEAINYSQCCTELNPEFAIGEQVLLTKRTLVIIDTFCEDGMIEIDDNNEYYKVDRDELTKRV